MEWIFGIVVIYALYSYNKNKVENKSGPLELKKSIRMENDDFGYDNHFNGKYVQLNTRNNNNDYEYTRSCAEPEKSKNKTKGQWIKARQEISIGSKTIANGLFYYGGVLKGERFGETECSLVDDGLFIKDAEYNFVDNSLGYWPSFYSLSPMCRGAYIDWLASKRDAPDVPIGYLFLYFYGLEKRIINCLNSNRSLYRENAEIYGNECAEICKEILRLKSIFKDNYSFNGYSSRLLNYVSIACPSVFCMSDAEIEDSIYSDVFKVKLAYTAHNNEPLKPELAYAWIKNHPDYNLRTPARRCSEEFKTLFILRYKEKFKDGIIINKNKTKLRLRYCPASGSLNQFEYGPNGLCDPSVLSAPVKKLATIAYQCTDELDAYSRYLGKQDTSRDDLNALLLLPNELIDEFEIPLIKDFKSWALKIINNQDGISSFKDFWSQTKLPLPSKLNQKDQELICNLIEKSGYAFAPNPTLHGNKMKVDDPIVIYEDDNAIKTDNTFIFDDIAIKLRLGVIIANADLKIHSNEVSYLANMIHSNNNISSQEKLSLEAYLKWLLNSDSNFNGLKACIGKLRNKDHEIVRKMLISVALSDGKIDPNEIKEIEKLYTTLGLDKSAVPADIHALSSRKNGLEVSTAKSSPTLSNKKEVFELDENILRTHETETRAAQDILNKIFKDAEEVEAKIEVNIEQGLTQKALSIYKRISHREKIDRAEFEKICSEYDFFVDVVIDSINEWSFEKLNAPVLEDDTDILIDREIAEELKELGDTL